MSAAVLFSKFGGEWVDNYGIELSGEMIQDGAIAEIHYLDKYRNLEPMRLPTTISGQRMTFNMHLGEYAVALIKIRSR